MAFRSDHTTRLLLTSLAALLSITPAVLAVPAAVIPSQVGPQFAYAGAAFDEVAQASYRTVGLRGSFEAWLAKAYQERGVTLGSGTGSLDTDLGARAAAIQAASGEARVRLERDTAAWAHTFIKKAVPKFSLERGFELANVVKTGERQCLAQSFVITGLLQRAGMRAGIVMVWANPEGKESNLGHMVSTVRLSSGTDLMVDASDPTPFVRHQGLLLKVGDGYRFVKPQYAADDSILRYTQADSAAVLNVRDTAPLGLGYIHSQFDYYRGERAIGGFLGTGVGKATPAGLAQSAMYLRRAVQDEPLNPLANFVLGHVLARQGQLALAKAQYQKANALYQQEGHVPSGVQTAIAALNKPAKAGKS